MSYDSISLRELQGKAGLIIFGFISVLWHMSMRELQGKAGFSLTSSVSYDKYVLEGASTSSR